MTIGLLQLRLRIPSNQSLKGKRQVLLGLKTRIRRKFNVSVAETEDQDKWQVATVAVACIGVEQTGVNRCLNQVVELAERDREAELTDVEMQFL